MKRMLKKITLESLAGSIADLAGTVDDLAITVKEGFDEVHQKFEGVDKRFDSIERRFHELHVDNQKQWEQTRDMNSLLRIVEKETSDHEKQLTLTDARLSQLET